QVAFESDLTDEVVHQYCLDDGWYVVAMIRARDEDRIQLSGRVRVDTPATIDAQQCGRGIEERIEILRQAVFPSAPGHHTALGRQFDRPRRPGQLIDER